MEKKPKLAHVAQEAGVSVATASQVLRGAGRISEATRKKVLAAAERLHYVRDGRAASMRSGENREIGFAIHQIANPFNAEVISGVSDLLESEGYLVSVLDSNDDTDRQRRNLEAFIRSSRGGLLWVPAQDTDQPFRRERLGCGGVGGRCSVCRHRHTGIKQVTGSIHRMDIPRRRRPVPVHSGPGPAAGSSTAAQ